jgi:hypothetical protein
MRLAVCAAPARNALRLAKRGERCTHGMQRARGVHATRRLPGTPQRAARSQTLPPLFALRLLLTPFTRSPLQMYKAEAKAERDVSRKARQELRASRKALRTCVWPRFQGVAIPRLLTRANCF